MEILTLTEQNKLVSQSRLKDLMTNDYLNDDNNENFKTIRDMFFDGSTEKTRQFNVGTNLFSTIADTIANFVGSPIADYNINLTKYTKDLVSVGKAVFGLKRIDNGTANGQLEIYHIPAENHLVSDGVDKVYTMYKNIEKDETIYYILKQEFTVGQIINTLYKLGKIVDNIGTEIPLETIKQTENLLPIINTGLDVPAIFTTELNELDGIQSELDKVKNLVYSLDRKAVMFETQFLGQVDQYKIFENIQIPDSAITDKGTVDITKMGKVVATTTGMSGDIKYVSNKNDLISPAIEYEKTQLQKISSATNIPVDFLGIPTTSAISGTSREIMISAFIKKIQAYRDVLHDTLEDIFLLFEGQVMDSGEVFESYIIWNDIISKNGKELVDELKVAIESGLISTYTGIQKYQGLRNAEDIEKEIVLISQNASTLLSDTENQG